MGSEALQDLCLPALLFIFQDHILTGVANSEYCFLLSRDIRDECEIGIEVGVEEYELIGG